MSEAEVVKIMREHLEGLFPKVCPNCGRTFVSLREYLTETRIVGSSIPYDADMGDWQPTNPVGTVVYSNCPCGSTLALSSDGIPLLRLWPLLNWARIETKKRGMTPQQLLNYLRDEICKQVLAPPEH